MNDTLIFRAIGEKLILHRKEAANFARNTFTNLRIREESFKLCLFAETSLVWYRKMGWHQIFVMLGSNTLIRVSYDAYFNFPPQEVKPGEKISFSFREDFKATGKLLIDGNLFITETILGDNQTLCEFHPQKSPKTWEDLVTSAQNSYDAMAKGVYPLTGE